MASVLALSFAQLRDPVHRKVLWRALAATVLLFVALWWGCKRLLAGLDTSGWPVWAAGAWADGGALLGALLILPLFTPLFAATATGIAEIWLDQVIGAVEARYYPGATARPVGPAASLRLGLGATGRLLVWNLLAMPFYVVLLITGIGTLLLFVVLNGWLLGRAYLEMVAMRHLPAAAVAPWIAAHPYLRWQAGVVAAGLFAVPVVNLVAPLVGAGMATHLFHRAFARRSRELV
jgi:CysZ protein